MAKARLAGIDEVGRGALAGPVVVGAVYIGTGSIALRAELESLLKRGLADSKKLTSAQRQRASTYLQEAVLWGIGVVEPVVIDREGIVAALRMAAGLALDELRKLIQVEAVIADAGLYHPYEVELPTERYIKADEQYLEVMLASILAKVHRDTLMKQLAVQHPHYGWERNVGYGSQAHRDALRQFGPTPLHRHSFLTRL